MKKVKLGFSNHYQFTPAMATAEINEQPSLTVPKMELDIKRSLERYRRGEEIATFTGVFTSEYGIDIPEFEKMSKLEKLDWAANNRGRLIEQVEAVRKAQEEAEKPKPESKPEPRTDEEPKPE